jgi:hypothetical protein
LRQRVIHTAAVSSAVDNTLRAILTSLPHESRARAAPYIRETRVRQISLDVTNSTLRAVVVGTATYDVFLRFSDNKYASQCSCPVGRDCKHVFAMIVMALGRSAQTALTIDDPNAVDLSDALAKKLQRKLTAAELNFFANLNIVYSRARYGRPLYPQEIELLRLWPVSVPQRAPSFSSAPRSEHECWLQLAYYATELGQKIPEFLAPITDLSGIYQQLEAQKLQREHARWTHVVERLATELRSSSSTFSEPVAFRIKFEQRGAVIEWQLHADGDFEAAKNKLLAKFVSDYDSGLATVSAESETLWALLRARILYFDATSKLSFTDISDAPILTQMLQNPRVASRIVNGQGNSFPRSTGSLSWQITPPLDNENQGAYQLSLVRSDGVPASELLFTSVGTPQYYVFLDGIFVGPRASLGLDALKTDNSIPASVIETSHGVSLLGSLGVSLPERLERKIRRIGYKIQVQCNILPSYQGSNIEVCYVSPRALSLDGAAVERWTGSEWVLTKGSTRNGGSDITIYDRSALDEIARLVAPLGLKADARGEPCLRVSKTFAATFYRWLASLPSHIDIELDGDLLSLSEQPITGAIKLQAQIVDIDWFDLTVVVDVSDTTLTPAELKLLLNAKGEYVRLPQRGWRRLQFELTADEQGQLAALGLRAGELSEAPQRMHALQLDNAAAKQWLPQSQVKQIAARAAEIKTSVTPPVPRAITATLRPYQLEGFHFLAYLASNNFGGILADDMGLGKTLQTLTWVAWLHETIQPTKTKSKKKISALAPPTLVVCPKSVMDTWLAEAKRFAPSLRVTAWNHGSVDGLAASISGADIHVINYSQLRLLGPKLTKQPWLAVILDEGQYIKNPSSQTAQVTRELIAQHRLILSGTPIENRLLDLWSLLSFAMPGILGTRADFGKQYNDKEDPYARQRLAARVRPFLLRRTKKQVAPELPSRIEEDLFCDIEGAQQTLYRAELKRAQQMLLKIKTQKQLAKEQFHVLTSMLRLRQICCHPALLDSASTTSSAKLEALLELLEPLIEQGRKVLVFSQFVDALQLIKAAVHERTWPIAYLDGETKDRGTVVDNFQAFDGPCVFLISLKAGSVGLNLTAASYVVLFDPWWNPAVENQAIDRTHRIGQTETVVAYRLLIKDSIEQKIRELQKNKGAVADDVLGEEKFANALTLDDFRFLFAD